jgi:hypothetical protein
MKIEGIVGKLISRELINSYRINEVADGRIVEEILIIRAHCWQLIAW